MNRTNHVSRPRRLYIEDLERPAPAAATPGKMTTLATGEEASKCGCCGDEGNPTTLAVGEECAKA